MRRQKVMSNKIWLYQVQLVVLRRFTESCKTNKGKPLVSALLKDEKLNWNKNKSKFWEYYLKIPTKILYYHRVRQPKRQIIWWIWA